MKKQLQDILKQLALSEKESLVFDLLLHHDSLTASEIAKKTAINRSTVYTLIASLESEGLVSRAQRYGVTVFQAIDATLLSSVIDRKKEMLSSTQQELADILPYLQAARGVDNQLPKVTYFSGVEGIKQAYEDTLVHNKEKEIHVFSGPDIVFQELGEEYVEYYVKKRKRLGISSKQIAPQTAWGTFIKNRDTSVLRKTMLIPEAFAFDTEMVMYDDKLAIFSFKNGTLMAVIIEDEAISQTTRTLFRYIETTIRE
jgi:sugar-specific transcriptional regulator TrmB